MEVLKYDITLLMLFSLVGIVVNLALPDQIKPPNGAENLSFLDQLMHMFVHHAQVPLTSSIIVAVIVLVSVYLGMCLAKYM